MHAREALDRLQLHDDLLVHEEVGAEAFLESQSVEAEDDGMLASGGQAAPHKRIRQHCFVHRLE